MFAGVQKHTVVMGGANSAPPACQCFKLTWLVLGGDPAARSHGAEVAKHTVVMGHANSAPRAPIHVSLFQPKTATIEDIAIALVKMLFVAVWRTTQDI